MPLRASGIIGMLGLLLVASFPGPVRGEGAASTPAAADGKKEGDASIERLPEPTCQPTKIEVLGAALRQGLDALTRKPEETLKLMSDLEAQLPCLSDAPKADELSRIYRLKGVAHAALKDRSEARAAFYQAVAYTPLMDCADVLDGHGASSVQRLAIPICQDAALEAQDSEVRTRFINLKGAVNISIDGVEKPIEDGMVSLRLVAGEHFVRVQSTDKLRAARLPVLIPDGESRIREIDLKKLGLVVVAEKLVEVGTLRIEGLEPGTEVMLDGRTRLDLPVLRNVEVGERHILIKLPDGSVMGATVIVAANEEAVYSLAASTGSSGGGNLKRLAGFGSLGVAALSALGSGLTFGMAASSFGDARTAYDQYSSAEGLSADYNALWGAVESSIEQGRRQRLLGFVLGGTALLTAGAGTTLIISDGGMARIFPFFAPMEEQTAIRLGMGLAIQGRF